MGLYLQLNIPGIIYALIVANSLNFYVIQIISERRRKRDYRNILKNALLFAKIRRNFPKT